MKKSLIVMFLLLVSLISVVSATQQYITLYNETFDDLSLNASFADHYDPGTGSGHLIYYGTSGGLPLEMFTYDSGWYSYRNILLQDSDATPDGSTKSLFHNESGITTTLATSRSVDFELDVSSENIILNDDFRMSLSNKLSVSNLWGGANPSYIMLILEDNESNTLGIQWWDGGGSFAGFCDITSISDGSPFSGEQLIADNTWQTIDWQWNRLYTFGDCDKTAMDNNTLTKITFIVWTNRATSLPAYLRLNTDNLVISKIATNSYFEDFENIQDIVQSTWAQNYWYINGTTIPEILWVGKDETPPTPCVNLSTYPVTESGSQALFINATKLTTCTIDTSPHANFYLGSKLDPTEYTNETNITFDMKIENFNINSDYAFLRIETGTPPDFSSAAGFIYLTPGGGGNCDIYDITGKWVTENMTHFSFNINQALERDSGCAGQLDHLYNKDLIEAALHFYTHSSITYGPPAYNYITLDNFGINSASDFTYYTPPPPLPPPTPPLTYLNDTFDTLVSVSNYTSYSGFLNTYLINGAVCPAYNPCNYTTTKNNYTLFHYQGTNNYISMINGTDLSFRPGSGFLPSLVYLGHYNLNISITSDFTLFVNQTLTTPVEEETNVNEYAIGNFISLGLSNDDYINIRLHQYENNISLGLGYSVNYTDMTNICNISDIDEPFSTDIVENIVLSKTELESCYGGSLTGINVNSIEFKFFGRQPTSSSGLYYLNYSDLYIGNTLLPDINNGPSTPPPEEPSGGGGGGAEPDKEAPVPGEDEELVCNPGYIVEEAEQQIITSYDDVLLENYLREKSTGNTCGIDGDQDGQRCDLNEDIFSCPEDCKLKLSELLCFDTERCIWTEEWALKVLLSLQLMVGVYLGYVLWLK